MAGKTLSASMTVPLSIIMFAFATILLAPDSDFDDSAKPVFTSLRNYDGEFFAARRMDIAPIHYGILHALPAAIWSVAMPLQYSNTLRKTRPRLHRFTGYIAFTSSFTLALTGIAFIPRNLSFSDPIFNMHRIHGIPLFPSSNFALLFVLSPAMIITGVRALYLAKNRRFDQHRQWAMYHGIAGYAIPLQRLYLLLSRIGGEMLSNSRLLQDFFGTNQIKSVHAKSDAERAVFSATVWIGIASSLAWVIYSRKAGKMTEAKNI